MTTSSDEALARLAAGRHGVFSGRHLDQLGFTPDARYVRVSTGRWVVLYDGVYRIGGAPATWHGDVLAACLAAGPAKP